MGYTEQFGCCLERALQSVERLESKYHLYNTTKECDAYLDPPLRNGTLFIHAVINFYMDEMENKTVCEEEDLCRQGTQKWYMAYVTFWTLALIIGIIGNILVCVAFLQSAVLRKTITNYFVTSLAISDLLVVIFIIPLKIHTALHNQEFCAPLIFCQTFYTSDVTFFAASITNLFIISIDRYIAIVRPYDYRDFLTPRRAKTGIILIWVYSAIWGLLVHFNPETNGFDAIFVKNLTCDANNQLFYRIQYVMVFYIPSFFMCFIYIKIMRISRTHARHIDARRNSLVGIGARRAEVCTFFPNANYFINHKLELRATKVVFVVYGTFLMCWLPLVFMSTFHYLTQAKVASTVVYSIVAEILPVTNSLLNPFIYGILHRDFKRSLRRMMSNLMLEYQMIGSLLRRRSSQSTRSYDASSQGTNPNVDDASGDYEINQNKPAGEQGSEIEYEINQNGKRIEQDSPVNIDVGATENRINVVVAET